MCERVVVAMSGGVDSSVAALLLHRAGLAVTGLFMRTGEHGGANPRSCCSAADARDARRVADLLGIPFYALDFESEFEGIVREFVAEYARGRTPNPCVLCNRDLKFGRLLEFAAVVGASRVATGHYAGIDSRGPRRAIRRGRDRRKDQSYVLFPLSQDQLRRSILPLGELTKEEVREIAAGAGLPVSAKPESQEICFAPAGGHRELLASRGVATPGAIVDAAGREVGRHPGAEGFTVGQRRGLGVALGTPRYVTAVEPATGTVRIGARDDLLGRSLTASGWTGGGREAPGRGESYRARVRIRSRHPGAPATVTGLGRGRVRIDFDEAQSAIAPGQAAVAYEDDRVAGGGWIEGAT